jgi:hypothetical protein
MAPRALLVSLAALALLAPAVRAQAPQPGGVALPFINTGSTDALAGILRGELVRQLPETLFDVAPNWGKTTLVRRVHYHGKGLKIRREVTHEPKNDGTWQHIRFNTVNLANSLILDIRDLQFHDGGRITFGVFVAFDGRVRHDLQHWEHGIRLYSGSTQARMRILLLLHCEVTYRFEANDTLVPDAVVRLHVVRADLRYDNLVVEHIAGVGGDLAKLLGSGAKNGLHYFHPHLEPELLAKGNAAIVKAADTRDVRLSLLNIYKNKGKTPPPLLKLPKTLVPAPKP